MRECLYNFPDAVYELVMKIHQGGVPERPKGTDCKSVGEAYGGSNPPPTTSLKIRRM